MATERIGPGSDIISTGDRRRRKPPGKAESASPKEPTKQETAEQELARVKEENAQLWRMVNNLVEIVEIKDRLLLKSETTTQGLLNQVERDELTNLLRRAALLERVKERREKVPFGVVLFSDVDWFKQFNTKYGHGVGDIVLQEVSNTLSKMLRTEDFAGRWGGEEFVIYFSGTTTKEILERFKDKIVIEVSFEYEDKDTHLKKTGHETVTLSGGLTNVSADEKIQVAITRANLLMLQAKEQGKNRLITDLGPGKKV